nr:MAG TPA: Decoration protein T5 Decoration Protein, Viral [Caudoviricetes sp.]
MLIFLFFVYIFYFLFGEFFGKIKTKKVWQKFVQENKRNNIGGKTASPIAVSRW